MTKLVIIRLRGLSGIQTKIRDTLTMLRLYRKHFCVVIEDTPANLGMIKKVKDYVTYGEIDDETMKLLIEKRQKIDSTTKEPKKFFRLQPPKGGFGRRGIKRPYTQKGTLGYQGKKINELIQRMV